MDLNVDLFTAQQPHDAFAKAIFAQPERATALFQQHLPPALVQRIDWQTLRLMPTAFVRKELAQTQSDLLFSVQASGRELRLYLLLEHQSTPDPWMPLRLLEYMVEVLREHRTKVGQPLPIVVPFVLNQGPEAWTISTRFAAMYGELGDLDAALRPFLLTFEYVLLDLTRADPGAEERDVANRVVLQLMKLARTNQLLSFFTWLAQEARRANFSEAEELLRLCLLYAYNVDVNLDLPEIADKLLHVPSLREDAMTLAQKLRQEGRIEGQERGEWIGKVRLLEEMVGQTPTPSAVLGDLSVAELQRKFADLQAQYQRQFKGAK